MTKPDPDLIEEVLHFDPLAQAERVTGKSYKEDEETSNKGLLMHLAHTDQKRRLLTEADDTHHSMSFTEALRIFRDEGFRMLLEEPFGRTGVHQGVTDTYVVMWHDDGILLTCDSYTWKGSQEPPTLNSGRINFCHSVGYALNLPMSRTGAACQLDVREGFRHNLAKLRGTGHFITPWTGEMMFHLNNGAWKASTGRYPQWGIEADAETRKYLDRLPEDVRAVIEPGWTQTMPEADA